MSRQDEMLKDHKFPSKICLYTNNLLYLEGLKQLSNEKNVYQRGRTKNN